MKDGQDLHEPAWRPGLEEQLGRKLRPEECGSIQDLNDIPANYLAEARILTGEWAGMFLEYLWDSGSRDWASREIKLLVLRDFVQRVVDYDGDPRSWLRGGIFFPWASDKCWLFQSSVDEILAPLEKKPNERWVMISVPDEVIQNTITPYGAPAIHRPDETYRQFERECRDHFLLNRRSKIARYNKHLDKLEPIHDIMIATRRWLANEAATEIGIAEFEGDPTELLRVAIPEIQTYSADVLIALRALHAERKFFPDIESRLPGFRGPDAWYVGELPEGV